MSSQKLPWWRIEKYVDDRPVPEVFTEMAGPHGLALVRAWPSGVTDTGWGLVGAKGDQDRSFIPCYNRGEFNSRRVVFGFGKGHWAFAFIMRSVRLVCIDIDGKNGGLEHAKRLGILPPTLAETSKSGDGYHLFYQVDEEWDDDIGFGLMSDRIGIEQGVDFRATGCVYHYKQQKWNERPVAKLPDHLFQLLQSRSHKVAATKERIVKVLDSQDELEILMMQDELVAELAKPMPVGKRNNTLFAIGSQMQEAQVPKWDELLADRAKQLGLDDVEADKLISNIERYSGVNAP